MRYIGIRQAIVACGLVACTTPHGVDDEGVPKTSVAAGQMREVPSSKAGAMADIVNTPKASTGASTVPVSRSGSAGGGSAQTATQRGSTGGFPGTAAVGGSGGVESPVEQMGNTVQTNALGFEGEGTPWEEPAPRASCGAGDMPEGQLQGEGVTNVRCNLMIQGQVDVPHYLAVAWHDTCAYVNSTDATSVVDVSDASAPVIVKTLTTSAMQNNWESMKVHEGRGLLVGYQANGTVVDIYDVSEDCRAPVFKSSINVGGIGHAGNFSVDGTIYYASSLYTGEVFAIDITDPAKPSVITGNFVDTAGNSIGSHDLSIGKDGTRGYFTFPSLVNAFNGTLSIVDLTAVQARAPSAQGRSVNDFEWQDGAASQYPIPITYRGGDFLMVTDELGSGACDNPDKPQFGYAHIFDIRNELKPTLVSKVKTAAQDVSNCEKATQSAGTFFGVGTHYCNVDRQVDPRILSCGLWSGGVRVFDIRNPWRPKEIAYFDTAGTDDMVPGLTRILTDTRQLWVASTAGVFYVLKFADGVLDEILAN